MKSVVTAENLRSFAYTNEEFIVLGQPVRGIVVEFMGLGNMSMFKEPHAMAQKLAEQGVILVVPFIDPWAWMNQWSIQQTDIILDVLMEIYGDLPIVSSGGSMGGMSCITFTCKSAHHPVACVANCPVCDLQVHYRERADLPRTLWSAFGMMDADTLDDAMANFSPLHLCLRDEMPDVPYIIFHCEEDQSVNKQLHSDRFVEAMRKIHHVEYYVVPGRGHCDLTDEMRDLYWQKISDALH